jgi:hypothetical protein
LKSRRIFLLNLLGVRRPPPRRDMNIQGFAGHPRPSRGAECSYPVPLKGSEPPRGDMNIQGVAIEPLFTQSKANEGVQQMEFPLEIGTLKMSRIENLETFAAPTRVAF